MTTHALRPSSLPPVRAAELILDRLVAAGVDVVFGIPGGTISPLYDALHAQRDIELVVTRHEQAAAFAAAGYARVTGKPGVVLVTSGPGVLNTFTAVASAAEDHVPLLVLSGEVPSTVMGKGALQEGTAHHLDVVASARPLTKWAAAVPSTSATLGYLEEALTRALTPPFGPVLLTLPLDVSQRPALRLEVSAHGYRPPAPDADAIDELRARLCRARRPLFFAGSALRWGQAPAQLRAVAEAFQVPVMTTPKAKGVLDEDHPLSLGVYGHGGHLSSSTYLDEGVDLLVVLGSSLRDPATNGWSPLLERADHIVRVDLRARDLGRNVRVDQALVADVGSVLDGLLDITGPAATAQRLSFPLQRDLVSGNSRASVGRGAVSSTHPALVAHPKSHGVPPPRALWELQEVMPSETIYTCDIGEHLLFATHFLRARHPRAFLAMTGLASMGSAIPAAIGARLACPDTPVVAIVGDGGFAMSGTEVATATQLGLPLIVCVLNDARFGMVEIGHAAVYGKRPTYATDALDVPTVARGMGARVIRVERIGDILEAAPYLLASKERPVVLDVIVDRDVILPKNDRNRSLKTVLGEARP